MHFCWIFLLTFLLTWLSFLLSPSLKLSVISTWCFSEKDFVIIMSLNSRVGESHWSKAIHLINSKSEFLRNNWNAGKRRLITVARPDSNTVIVFLNLQSPVIWLMLQTQYDFEWVDCVSEVYIFFSLLCSVTGCPLAHKTLKSLTMTHSQKLKCQEAGPLCLCSPWWDPLHSLSVCQWVVNCT